MMAAVRGMVSAEKVRANSRVDWPLRPIGDRRTPVGNGRQDITLPLRDHFRPPLNPRRHWEGLHGQWPAMMVLSLASQLPPRYFAEPRVHSGSSAEIDVATFENEPEHPVRLSAETTDA